jgi:LysR family hydrogen peroxide-inducible transcriptional activator
VADTRHFGRAAERTFVSQPTLSAQLKKLEEYLGVQLIERSPKRVSLTVAGEEIVERARRIVEASEEIIELAKGTPTRFPAGSSSPCFPPSVPIYCRTWPASCASSCPASSSCCTSIRPT